MRDLNAKSMHISNKFFLRKVRVVTAEKGKGFPVAGFGCVFL